MIRIAVIGAGHAGVEAALAARMAGAEVVDLFSAEPVLPYFRPRLVAVACGQTEPEAISIHPLAWFEEKGVHLHLDAPVVIFDPENRRIVCRAADATFNGVVLACGAMPVIPRINGRHERMPVFTIWSMADALALRLRIRQGAQLVVMGGGIIGIEAALRAMEAGASVSLIEKQPWLMYSHLGLSAGSVLARVVQACGVNVHCARSVCNLSETAGGVAITLDDGLDVQADALLLASGACSNRTLAQASGLATDIGVLADENLQTAYQGVFVAGDMAQSGRPARYSLKEAGAHGRVAGANVVAYTSGQSLQRYISPVAMLTMKAGRIEVYTAGVPAGVGDCEERLDDGAMPGIYRGVVRRAGVIVGVQMVGTREGFDELAEQVVGP